MPLFRHYIAICDGCSLILDTGLGKKSNAIKYLRKKGWRCGKKLTCERCIAIGKMQCPRCGSKLEKESHNGDHKIYCTNNDCSYGWFWR